MSSPSSSTPVPVRQPASPAFILRLMDRLLVKVTAMRTSAAVLLLLVVPAAAVGAQPPGAASGPAPPVLRVCADPNNLPFSNERLQGFENRLAEMVARDLGMRLSYTWWAQRRAFVRNTLNEGLCDVVMGVPAGYFRVLTTSPYYRSAYVWVSQAKRRLALHSLDDTRLGRWRIGIQLVGDDPTPPSRALAARGLARNFVGYTAFGDYSQPDPALDVVRAVQDGQVDLAVVWGPLAGYVASRSRGQLLIAPFDRASDGPDRPFEFDIAVGVKKGNVALRDRLERVLQRRRAEIRRLLQSYGVPLRTRPAAASVSKEARDGASR